MRKPVYVLVAVLLCLMAVATVMAQTEFNLSWNGGGIISSTIDTGDARASFVSAAVAYQGSLYAKDYDNNPYGYGVDSFLVELNSEVWGGETELFVERLTSKESMYGQAGQTSYSYLGADHGALTFRVTTNYASMKSSNYGFQSNNQFVAEGGYLAVHAVNNTANEAYFIASGNDGTLNINHMSDESHASEIRFGWGCGCYTNADVYQTGAGMFEIGSTFTNSFSNSDFSAGGSGTYMQRITFTDGFTWEDYSLTAK